MHRFDLLAGGRRMWIPMDSGKPSVLLHIDRVSNPGSRRYLLHAAGRAARHCAALHCRCVALRCVARSTSRRVLHACLVHVACCKYVSCALRAYLLHAVCCLHVCCVLRATMLRIMRARSRTTAWSPRTTRKTKRGNTLRRRRQQSLCACVCARACVSVTILQVHGCPILRRPPPLPQLHRDWAHPWHICRDWAHPWHICTKTGQRSRESREFQ